MKRIAVLVEQKYEELELWYPVYRFREAGAAVTIIGPEAGKTYPSKLGYPATADKAAADVKASDFDAIIIPGGFCPDYLRRSHPTLRFVRDAHAAARSSSATSAAESVAPGRSGSRPTTRDAPTKSPGSSDAVAGHA